MVNSTFLPNRIGGAELHTLWVARELQQQGHEISLVSGGSNATNLQTNMEESITEIQGIRTISLEFPRSQGVGSWGVHETLLDWALDFLAQERPDFIHFGLFWDLVGIANAAKRFEIPYAITSHLYSLFCYNGFLLLPGRIICDGLAERTKCRRCIKGAWSYKHRLNFCLASTLPTKYRDKLAEKLPVARGLRTVDEIFSVGRDFANHASLLVAPTKFVRRELLKNRFDASKIVVIPYGLPPYIVEYEKQVRGAWSGQGTGKRDKPFRFTVISRLSPEKGLATLIKAFRSLDYGSSAQLSLYGEGPANYLRHLKFLAENDIRICFRGPVGHARVPEILLETEVLIIPSEWKEVSGIAAREALAFGIPVIASEIGGLPEAVKHEENGLLVKPGDVDGIRAALQRCLERKAPEKPLSMEKRRIVTIEENVLMTLSAFHSIGNINE